MKKDINERDQLDKSSKAVQDFYSREETRISGCQRSFEQASNRLGRPWFFLLILAVGVLWMIFNVALKTMGVAEPDPPPFFWLQGLLCFTGLLVSILVLSRQNRLGDLAERVGHLDMKVTLLTEQKVSKIIELLEELRQDLPNVKNRDDPGAEAMLHAMSPEVVLTTLDEATAAQRFKADVSVPES